MEHHVHCIHRSGAVPAGFPCPCADLAAALEAKEKAERERDEARRDFFKVAEAIGMVNYPEGQAPWPASADEIAEAVQRDRDEDRAEVERLQKQVTELLGVDVSSLASRLRATVDTNDETARLRTVVVRVADAVGAKVSRQSSLDFMEDVPREVALVVNRITKERDDALHAADVEARIVDERGVTIKQLRAEVERIRRHVKALAAFVRDIRDDARNIESDADRVLYALGDDDV